MIISIDGARGSGKTTLGTLLTTNYPNAKMVFVDEYSQMDTMQKEIVDYTADFLNKGREFFDEKGYEAENKSVFMLLLYTARLKFIQSNPDVKKYDYIFIDTFFDPLWTFEKEYRDIYFEFLKNMIEMPDLSFFLKASTNRTLRRRVSETDTSPDLLSEAEKSQWDKKISDFCRFGQNALPNFHVLNAGKPIADVLQSALTHIENATKTPQRPNTLSQLPYA